MADPRRTRRSSAQERQQFLNYMVVFSGLGIAGFLLLVLAAIKLV
jgi:Tfp pilus assembly protein PilN